MIKKWTFFPTISSGNAIYACCFPAYFTYDSLWLYNLCSKEKWNCCQQYLLIVSSTLLVSNAISNFYVSSNGIKLSVWLITLYLPECSARWIGNHGFSIGIDDVQPGKKLIDEKGKTISNGYRHCNKLIADYNGGRLALKSGCDATQTLETEITERLNKLREEAGDVRIWH